MVTLDELTGVTCTVSLLAPFRTDAHALHCVRLQLHTQEPNPSGTTYQHSNA